MAQRKATCKEAWNQDLTDHGALLGQLHTIRTASLEQRHGSGKRVENEKNVTHIEVLKTISNPDIQKYDVASLSLVRTFFFKSNCSINLIRDRVSRLQSKVSVYRYSIYFLRILQCTFKSYIQTHHQDVHICCQTGKQKTYNPHEIT